MPYIRGACRRAVSSRVRGLEGMLVLDGTVSTDGTTATVGDVVSVGIQGTVVMLEAFGTVSGEALALVRRLSCRE